MNFAMNPVTGQFITAEEFVKTYGQKALGAKLDHRPIPFCDFCKQNMSHIAGKTEGSYGHFSHRPNSAYCPSKAKTGEPYGKLTPSNPDPERAKWLKALVRERWRWVFHEISKKVNYFDALEFIELIKIADHDGLWGYRHLELIQVPELLLVIRDFTPTTSRIIDGKRRTKWVRFWFSANIRAIEDLWIVPPKNVRLCAVELDPPSGRRKYPDPTTMSNPEYVERVKFVPHSDPLLYYPYAETVIPRQLKCK
jgi:hypothetical protein